MDIERLEQNIYIDVGVHELLYNILCVYYYRMIYIMVIHNHQKQDEKPHISTENMNIGPWFCVKTPSKNMTTGANTLSTTSQNHTKTWTLGIHYEKEEDQYELN